MALVIHLTSSVSQIASSDQGFTATPTDPAYHYHSIYDSQMWQEMYADPGFHRHVRHDSSHHLSGPTFYLSRSHLRRAWAFSPSDCRNRSSYLSIPQNTHCSLIPTLTSEDCFIATVFLTNMVMSAWKGQFPELLLCRTFRGFATLS